MARRTLVQEPYLLVGGSRVWCLQLTIKILVEAIKYPVNMLKKSNRSLIMFPSGSRHSSDVGWGAVIAKMAKVKISQLSIRTS